MAERAQISVAGVVQGVGFRPYVYSLAKRLGLFGYVANTAGGVQIDLEGDSIPEFLRRLPAEAPPLSRITGIAVTPLPPRGYTDFSIHESTELSKDRPFTLISSDVSICRDCLRELNDPQDRRYRYPFINCTNCGPRYTITRAVPYDRPNTTMSVFPLCPACSKEYHDPADRRFHAQPVACPECGPKCEITIQNPKFKIKEQDPIQATIDIIRQGGIVAVKGLGGFHIACDAMNHDAVAALRERKRRSNKPFAVMAASTDAIRTFCEVTPEEQELLESPKRPIVLLRKNRGAATDQPLSDAVAPKNQYLGCMLPYTPLHALLFAPSNREPEAGRGALKALVMTSGNLSEEPIVHTHDEAIRKLSGLADAFLFHDRDIFMRVDDSVVRVRSAPDKDIRGQAACGVRNGNDTSACTAVHASKSTISFFRRSRGYAPEAIALHDAGPEVLGCGADLKNTFTLTKGSFAIPSQHIGDMENYETLKFYEETLANLKQVYRVDPIAIVHDLHPGYLSTRWARGEMRSVECGVRNDIPVFGIQHHYAHIGSVMAEHGLTDRVIGVAFDGTGYGADGHLWGGEFLIAGIEGFERTGQIKYIPLPGGEAAIREPWRTAISYVADAAGEDTAQLLSATGFVDRYGQTTVEQVLKITHAADLSPYSSGAGRLFDAVSALLGVCDLNTFEGEAAIALEALIKEGVDAEYPVVLTRENEYTVLDFSMTIRAIITDLLRNEPRSIIATRFHNTVAAGIAMMVRAIHQRTGLTGVALSGGTFQNLYLLRRTEARLAADGMRVHANVQMPPNDACISLGQAYLVRERLKMCGVRNAECGR